MMGGLVVKCLQQLRDIMQAYGHPKFTNHTLSKLIVRGVYTTRWGDAAIKSIGIALSVEESKVHRFSDIGYTPL